MITLQGERSLLLLNQSDARWVQERLIDAKYLKEGNADGGIAGAKTLAAFNAWKLDSFQDQLNMIGPGSVGLYQFFKYGLQMDRGRGNFALYGKIVSPSSSSTYL